VRIDPKRDLLAAVDAARPRPAHPNAPGAERDLAVLMTVTHRSPVGVVPALRAHDIADLFFHQLTQHAEPDSDAQRQQPVLRRPDELAERLLHARRQHLLHPALPADLLVGGVVYGPHAVLLSSRTWLAPVTLATRADEAGGPPPQLLRATGQPPLIV